MVGNQSLVIGSFFGGWEETSPLPPSKGEMRRASIHEQYDVGTGESASRTGICGTGGTGETGGSASRTGDYGTSGAGGTGETSEKLWEAWEG